MAVAAQAVAANQLAVPADVLLLHRLVAVDLLLVTVAVLLHRIAVVDLLVVTVAVLLAQAAVANQQVADADCWATCSVAVAVKAQAVAVNQLDVTADVADRLHELA